VSQSYHFMTPVEFQARAPPNNAVTLHVPGTLTSLRFSNYKSLMYQTETDLCIIEALADIFATVVRNKQDGFPRFNKYVQSYGEVIIVMDDWAPPAGRLTYGILTSALRGVALFYSLYGYFGVDIDIMDGKWGKVGTGIIRGGSLSTGSRRR